MRHPICCGESVQPFLEVETGVMKSGKDSKVEVASTESDRRSAGFSESARHFYMPFKLVDGSGSMKRAVCWKERAKTS